MSGGVPTRLHARYLPQGKEKLLLRHPLSQKNMLFTSASTLLRLNCTKQNYYGGITKQMNFNYPRHWNQWKYWAKWHRLGVTHFLIYSSLKCSKQTFTVRSAIVNSYFVYLPLRGKRGNWKKLFLSCGRFHSLLVAFRNSKTRRHSEIKQTRPSTKQDFSWEDCQNKTLKPH